MSSTRTTPEKRNPKWERRNGTLGVQVGEPHVADRLGALQVRCCLRSHHPRPPSIRVEFPMSFFGLREIGFAPGVSQFLVRCWCPSHQQSSAPCHTQEVPLMASGCNSTTHPTSYAWGQRSDRPEVDDRLGSVCPWQGKSIFRDGRTTTSMLLSTPTISYFNGANARS